MIGQYGPLACLSRRLGRGRGDRALILDRREDSFHPPWLLGNAIDDSIHQAAAPRLPYHHFSGEESTLRRLLRRRYRRCGWSSAPPRRMPRAGDSVRADFGVLARAQNRRSDGSSSSTGSRCFRRKCRGGQDPKTSDATNVLTPLLERHIGGVASTDSSWLFGVLTDLALHRPSRRTLSRPRSVDIILELDLWSRRGLANRLLSAAGSSPAEC